MPIAGVSDDLAGELPLHAEAPHPLAPSAQARALLVDLERRRERLQRAGVDATVFPTIPSTTITYTVMANAHRIASLDA